MSTPAAYLNGRLIPADQLTVPIFDAGFVLGATVTEQVRTFGGRLFRLGEHFDRFRNSLRIVGIEIPFTDDQLAESARSLVAGNHALLASGDDLGLSIFATPGPFATLAPAGAAGPTMAMHTYPLPFGLFGEKYQTGQALLASDVRQIPQDSLPRQLKCRSRMHYYIADQRADASDGGARALMLDADDSVLETTTANIIVYRQAEGLLSPPKERILPGISVATTLEIAASLNLPHSFRDLTLDDVSSADEVMLTSTSVCVLPVTRVDRRAIADGKPGPMFRQLLDG